MLTLSPGSQARGSLGQLQSRPPHRRALLLVDVRNPLDESGALWNIPWSASCLGPTNAEAPVLRSTIRACCSQPKTES